MTHHIPFTTWAAVAVIAAAVVVAIAASGPVRKHFGRLAGSLAVGAVAALGVTGWVDGKHGAQIARASHGHPASTLVPAFIVITLVVAVLAFAVSSRRQRPPSANHPAARRPYASARRDW